MERGYNGLNGFSRIQDFLKRYSHISRRSSHAPALLGGICSFMYHPPSAGARRAECCVKPVLSRRSSHAPAIRSCICNLTYQPPSAGARRAEFLYDLFEHRKTLNTLNKTYSYPASRWGRVFAAPPFVLR